MGTLDTLDCEPVLSSSHLPSFASSKYFLSNKPPGLSGRMSEERTPQTKPLPSPKSTVIHFGAPTKYRVSPFLTQNIRSMIPFVNSPFDSEITRTISHSKSDSRSDSESYRDRVKVRVRGNDSESEDDSDSDSDSYISSYSNSNDSDSESSDSESSSSSGPPKRIILKRGSLFLSFISLQFFFSSSPTFCFHSFIHSFYTIYLYYLYCIICW